MTISRLVPLLLCLCLIQLVGAQTIISRITFPIDADQTIHTLARAGVDLTHGHYVGRNSFTTDADTYERTLLDNQGIRYTVVVPDLMEYRHQSQHQNRGGTFLSCQDHSADQIVPTNFELGTYGGFYSMGDVKDILDIMQFFYPNLISVRKPIGNFKTYKNNSIYYVKISDHPDIDEDEPQILYTGLHHAREFISVSELIYYMWYLLENYDKNPLVKEIVDHTELYFVPVVNPDGMEYNIQGYDADNDSFTRDFRKNMRDNDSNGIFDPQIDGVDLNRNYGHEWGFDDEGSSGFMGSINYRGPAPFSEPETQAIQYLVDHHHFQVALNAHSYGDLLIFPWGFNDMLTPDSLVFTNYAELMAKQNGFAYGTGTQTVGYITNGDSDDWMYGDKSIFSMTDEIGDEEDGFYPLKDRIIPLCQSTLEMNLLAARLVNSLVQVTDETPDYIQPGVNSLDLEFNRYGLLDNEILISFHPLSPHILQVPNPILMDLQKFQPDERHLTFQVDNAIPYGATVKMEIICQQGEYTFRDTLSKTRADFHTIISDSGDNLLQWDNIEGNLWGTTNAAYKSGPVSITDSPFGNYLPNSYQPLTLRSMVDLTKATTAYAQFWAKWDIEDHYDYVVFQASTDGENWDNLCGEQSRLGSIFQLYEEPLYDGRQLPWVFETTDLSSYVGRLIQLRFLLVSDGFEEKDGFYFDDFKVITVDQNSVATSDVTSAGVNVYPNPANGSFTISLPGQDGTDVEIFNNLGMSVYQASLAAQPSVKIDASQWPAGLYHYLIRSHGQTLHNGSISLLP